MRMLPLGLLYQAEVVDKKRWDGHPLELVFFDCDRSTKYSRLQLDGLISQWNMSFRGGLARPSDTVDAVTELVPSIIDKPNPNLFLVPTHCGFSELHAMLASVVPPAILERHGIEKIQCNFFLAPLTGSFLKEEEILASSDPEVQQLHSQRAEHYATRAVAAFEEYIWSRIAGSRVSLAGMAPTSSLRLLAGDHRFWMSRLYRIAIERAEEMGSTDVVEERWESMEELRSKFYANLPVDERDRYELHRPLRGGHLWYPDDQDECDAVVEEVINGSQVIDSLTPILEVLRTTRCHEDFSNRYSWVKEDFERSFYSKRAKLKVSLVETLDDLPAWTSSEPLGYENILFRDVLSYLEPKDRHLVIAVRQGKTSSEVAKEMGHRGHASISRRLAGIKERIARILGVQPSE